MPISFATAALAVAVGITMTVAQDDDHFARFGVLFTRPKSACKLIPDPPHGRYKLVDPPHAEPDQAFPNMTMDVICDPGYGIVSGRTQVNCRDGYWSWELTSRHNCERYCDIPKDPNVEFRCSVQKMPPRCFRFMPSGNINVVPCPIPEGADKGYRPCKEYEPNGTVVQPVCQNGYKPAPMTCYGGSWGVIHNCDGTVTLPGFWGLIQRMIRSLLPV